MGNTMKYIPLVFAAMLSVACSGNGGSREAGEEAAAPVATAPVTESVTPPSQSRKVLVSKGVIRSANEVKVFSRIEGQLLDVKLLEGTSVRAGEPLFRLDDWELKGKLEMSRTAYEQAQLRMKEILVGQGYKRDRLDAVPEEIQEYARVKSGVNVCASDLEFNRSKLEKTVIKAPVSGLVTGINALSYSFVEPGETLCTIVDPKNLIVEFSILETELRKFEVGTVVEVRAIAYNEILHSARVRSIGTVVDEAGMVKIEAVLSDSDHLLPGMTAIVNL